ncbi:MAG: transposase [Xenococcaceae cyanobacterium MO_207.B15]|nr:transposase [Xenococcaceae cyanobacterium MO_207.B15]
MLVLEFKLKVSQIQKQSIGEAIRTAQFIRNSCLRYWMDGKKEDKINRYSLNKYTKVLADNPDFPWAKKLNSMARQAAAERTWYAISRFFDNCKKGIQRKKGYPRFKKNSRSVEYKTTGWSLSDDRKYLTMTDKFNIGRIKLIGSRNLHFYATKLIKRVRLIRRADGFYAQFCIDVERNENQASTGNKIGIDLGLNHFYTDSNGNKIDNPRFLRKSLKLLKKRQRQVSKKKKGSANRRKAINKLGRKHLKVSRQRKDFVVKAARTLCTSNDVIVLENLNVRGLVKNHNLALSISDASWSIFREWLEYFGEIFNREIIAVDPKFTSQDCSNCGKRIKKSLSTRTHVCSCGAVLCRDHNAAINILNKGTGGQSETIPVYGIDASGQMILWLIDENLETKVAG